MKKFHFLIFIPFVLFFLCPACNNYSQEQELLTQQKLHEEKEGIGLVKQYCSSCHLPVMANVLDQDSWVNYVLPDMAPRLGIKVFGGKEYVYDPYDSSSAISFENWSKIVDYYTNFAPLKLDSAGPTHTTLIKSWSIFELKKPAITDTGIAHTVMVSIDSADKKIYSSDGYSKKLLIWNSSLQVVRTTALPSPTTSATFINSAGSPKKVVFTSMGTMIASDISRGTLLEYDLSKNLQKVPDTIYTSLQRPVHSTPADFNKDGLTDWVVSCFGHTTGGLYWLEQLPGKKYKKNVILEIPGATSSVEDDYNHDGWPDIMVLFAHAEESIRLFLNDQKGSFTSKTLLQFSPVAGSSGFQLIDFNKDGLLDILYTSGDNSDLSRIIKPFHGIYIYINQGNFNYEKAWFYPVNGCTKAIAADFDQDGDLDIASIAFYADLVKNPGEKFIYFEQDTALHFVPYSPPIESYGRWICLDVNDYDGDGDADIVLGNFAGGFLNEKKFKPDWKLNWPLVVLENKTK